MLGENTSYKAAMTLYGPKKKELELVLTEINENQETLEQNISILRNWLACQPHLPNCIDDQIVRVFLRGCKHNVERTKRKIESYFTGRIAVPELFSNRDPCSSEIKMAARNLNIYLLPELTPEGCRVTIHSLKNVEIDQLDIQAIIKYIMMIADIRVMEETPISGDIFVFDIQDVTLAHCTKMTSAINLLRKTLILAQEAYPQRLKEIHILNAPSFIEWILNIFRSLMKEKMRNRFHVHTNYETLTDYVPQTILPNEYGGNGKTAQEYHDNWLKKLESYQEWFNKQESVKINEKRQPHYKTSNDMFGYEGAFRSLNID
ncbi:hypothetical protein L9F63_009924 [Diploptera punctata]|uniref:CRAL-TRIO domain-containing protein n=1 Tax=Diploptera punctata TaxID=6984 RepID=A0AAD8ES18_DIPPU|nr:hypothetical protein L9F63_009924 [Diploptera punctata]